MRDSKEEIINDFKLKQLTYYENNYAKVARANYLRRLRRRLILESIDNSAKHLYVLDVGCGPAILYPDLLKNSVKYFALDLVETNLSEIRKNNHHSGIICIQADLDSFYCKNQSFDIIICSGVLEYTDHPEANLLKIFRFLAKDGTLICSFPNVASPYTLWNHYVYQPLGNSLKTIFNKNGPCYVRKLFSAQRIGNLLRPYQPSQMVIRYFGHKLIPQPFDRILGYLDQNISGYLENHSSHYLEQYCAEFLLVLRK